MEYLVDPEPNFQEEEEEYQQLEVDPGLLLRKDHLSWLFGLTNSVSEQVTNPLIKSELSTLQFCISCCRYLTTGEDATTHRHSSVQGPHQLCPMMQVQSTISNSGMTANYYVTVQALRQIQVPIGDVLSHLLPHPRADGVGNYVCRSLYVYPHDPETMIWQGDPFWGKCAFRDCERVLEHKQNHLRRYGITPQFCSISCKLNTWLRCTA